MPDLNPTTAHEPIRAVLPRWANQQDGWCRAITDDVLKSRNQPSGLDIDRYLKLLLSEKKLSEESFQPVTKIEEKQVVRDPLDPVRLVSLKLGDGVNALKPGAQIDFAPAVTVIFGENGSGKSGFVRVLKRAAGVRTAEDILHNIRGDKHPVPAATFSVTVGTATHPIEWKNEFGVAPLNRIAIFDIRGARLHIEEDLTYVYTPGELTLFPLVQGAVERVRTALEGTITARTPGPNMLLASFDRTCTIYASIETLGSATDLDEIRKYATLPDQVDATIESLSTQADALKSTNIQNELKRLRDRLVVVKALRAAIATVKTFDLPTFITRVRRRADTSRRSEEAGNRAFENVRIPGVLGPEWRQFIQAGEEYLKKNVGPSYPAINDPCAYCRQPLTKAAAELVRKYRDFTNNEIRAAFNSADRELRQYATQILDLNVQQLQQQLAAEIVSDQDILGQLTPGFEQIAKLSVAVAGDAIFEWGDKDSVLAAAEKLLSDEEARLTRHISDLQASADERQAALKAKQTELIELQAQKTTSTLLPQIEKRVADAKWVARGNDCEKQSDNCPPYVDRGREGRKRRTSQQRLRKAL